MVYFCEGGIAKFGMNEVMGQNILMESVQRPIQQRQLYKK